MQLKANLLESISFEIRLLGDLDALDWHQVDQILMQPGFGKLSSVQFRLKTWHTALQRESEACTTLTKRLSSLHAKGLVQLAN
ncbi:hypothetical protein NM688_g5576 [Phlebia brevispora]|uniref:Uncharacterized protein n=1 Tax=Phlebia brevispora TaxID=194682 RepID=A0ACC1ST03_9APHY|nr:hypothetical protein NM688_g5576 [Phlebia brevispora]